MGEEKIEIKKCLRCNYRWWPRKPGRPLTCPKCRSPYWDKERQIKKKK